MIATSQALDLQNQRIQSRHGAERDRAGRSGPSEWSAPIAPPKANSTWPTNDVRRCRWLLVKAVGLDKPLIAGSSATHMRSLSSSTVKPKRIAADRSGQSCPAGTSSRPTSPARSALRLSALSGNDHRFTSVPFQTSRRSRSCTARGAAVRTSSARRSIPAAQCRRRWPFELRLDKLGLRSPSHQHRHQFDGSPTLPAAGMRSAASPPRGDDTAPARCVSIVFAHSRSGTPNACAQLIRGPPTSSKLPLRQYSGAVALRPAMDGCANHLAQCEARFAGKGGTKPLMNMGTTGLSTCSRVIRR